MTFSKGQSIYDLYFDETDKYTKIYGKKTVILMQVGSFYEVYGIYNKTDGTYSGSIIKEIADKFGLHIAEKKSNYAEYSDEKIVMAGFPDYRIDECRKLTVKVILCLFYSTK